VCLINRVREIIGLEDILNMDPFIEKKLRRKFARLRKDVIVYKASFFCIP